MGTCPFQGQNQSKSSKKSVQNHRIQHYKPGRSSKNNFRCKSIIFLNSFSKNKTDLRKKSREQKPCNTLFEMNNYYYRKNFRQLL